MEHISVDLQTAAPHPALRRFVRYYSQRRLAVGDNLQEPFTARLGGLLKFHFASLHRIPICGTDRFESCAPMLVVGPITYRRVQLHADGAVTAAIDGGVNWFTYWDSHDVSRHFAFNSVEYTLGCLPTMER